MQAVPAVCRRQEQCRQEHCVVDKSTLGLGVVIGSEVFNQMVICAASVLYAQGGVLKVDWRVVTRDCGGYAIACLMLIWIVVNKSVSGALLERDPQFVRMLKLIHRSRMCYCSADRPRRTNAPTL